MKAIRQLLGLPIVKTAYRYRFDRQFEKNGVGMFRGVYSNFAEAQHSAPRTKPLGYDNPEPASLYRERLHRLYPSDYAVLFWLERLFAAGCRKVCDVGGHVGVAFYSFRRYLKYPDDLTWTVIDVPAVCTAGRELAAKLGVDGQLGFASDPSIADGYDVLLAAGSLQYVETPLWQTLGAMQKPPPTLLVNSLPVTEGGGFVTLQNIGIAYCPYVIFNDRDVLAGFESKGYALYDRWEALTHYFKLPLNPEREFGPYSGFLFASEQSALRPPSPLQALADDARAAWR